jgi:hypothetical protein
MSWVREKESWLITTNERNRSSLDPIDTATGMWTKEDLEKTMGSQFEIIPLKGKWAGEVLVRGHRLDEPFNEFADNLAEASLGFRLELRGTVLMTKECLVSL